MPIFSELIRNPVFTGMVASMLMGSILYGIRAAPFKLWEFLQWQFTSSLQICSEDPSFEIVNNWLANHPKSKKSRRIRMSAIDYYDGRETTIVFTLGMGTHLLFYKRRPVLVTRLEPPGSGTAASWKRREDILVMTFGRSPSLLQDLCKDIVKSCREMAGATVDVFVYNDRWRLVGRRSKRSLESVILPEGQKQRLVDDFDKFRSSRQRYHDLGIPYRRGYLLEGPPGCGKTSLAFALASHYGMPIYALNLGNVKNDEQLMDAHFTVPEHALLLIEDVDATHAKRGVVVEAQSMVPGVPSAAPVTGITLSALLNCIDGVFSKEGRISIMTTNHPELIDPALLRKGRVDLREYIGHLKLEEMRTMCLRFMPNEDITPFLDSLNRTDIPAVELQGDLLAREAA